MGRQRDATGAWTRLEALDYRLRVAFHSLARLVRWGVQPAAFRVPETGEVADHPVVLASRWIPRAAPTFGPRLEAGRWANLRRVAAALDGRVVAPERPFSFWRCVGRLSRWKGFRAGAHYESGCIVPATGGGVCALTDALFEVALRSGCRILERHGHTLMVQGRPSSPDATVKWPYVDLRFAPTLAPLLIRCVPQEGGIVVAVHAASPPAERISLNGDHAAEPGAPAHVRTHTLRIRERPGGPPTVELVASDRKRLLADPRRNCETCREPACARRRHPT